MDRNRLGIIYGLAAYLSWGLFPLYWALLPDVPAIQILAHRIVWSFAFVFLLLACLGKLARFISALRPLRQILYYLVSAILIALNWGIYIWAIQEGHVLETSLGYFICPIMNIVVGMAIFGERLSARQWSAVLLALMAVLYLSFSYGRFPWIALVLAVSFALYGAMRKKSRLESLEGLLFESGVLCLPALGFLIFVEYNGHGALLAAPLRQQTLLLGAGVVTALPLIWFAASARRLPLTTIGMLQYIAPSCQFLLAVFWFREPCPTDKLVAFMAIWIALAIYSSEFGRKKKLPEVLLQEA